MYGVIYCVSSVVLSSTTVLCTTAACTVLLCVSSVVLSSTSTALHHLLLHLAPCPDGVTAVYDASVHDTQPYAILYEIYAMLYKICHPQDRPFRRDVGPAKTRRTGADVSRDEGVCHV